MNHNVNAYIPRVDNPMKARFASHKPSHLGDSEHRYVASSNIRMDLSKEKENDRVNNLDKRSKRPPPEEESKRAGFDNQPTFKNMSKAQYQAPSNIQYTQPTE